MASVFLRGDAALGLDRSHTGMNIRLGRPCKDVNINADEGGPEMSGMVNECGDGW